MNLELFRLRDRAALACVAVCSFAVASAAGANFTRGTERAEKFGVHQISLSGVPGTQNPFDVIVKVSFTPPSGERDTKIVEAFYDGDNTWRARVYVGEPGRWRWKASAPAEFGLDRREGEFDAIDSKLRGRLLRHPRNSAQWMTEDGRWFLNVNDTAYFLFAQIDTLEQPITFDDFTAYVRQAGAQGVTSLRAFLVMGDKGKWIDDKVTDWTAGRWTDGYFTDASGERLREKNFQRTDERLAWMLNETPDMYVQLVLLPRASRWRFDDQAWHTFSAATKERVLRYLVARYSAFPQVFWLAVNDAQLGPKYPRHEAQAREVGEYFLRHDPWPHPFSTGPTRGQPFPFANEQWATYIHLERKQDLDAEAVAAYRASGKPIFCGEDYYEQDHLATDPVHPDYSQRRLFWSWLLSGGSANYGGRWGVLHPYRATEGRRWVRPEGNPVYKSALRGLDSTPQIARYFAERNLTLVDFLPDEERVTVPGGRTARGAPKLMRREFDEWLVYLPNAAEDGLGAAPAREAFASVRLDLRSARGDFLVEWFRPSDGVALLAAPVSAGDLRDLSAPWRGTDVVLRLQRNPAGARP